MLSTTPAPPPSTERSFARWEQWLEELDTESLDPTVLESLRQVYREIIQPTGHLPGGMSTAEGSYLLTWDFADHHLELELFPTHWERFYKNRTTGRLLSDEDLSLESFAPFKDWICNYGKHSSPAVR